ncbi:MAG: TetR/AcrR family transcriptional regulator [Anaerolineales bacterium]|nr:MAG: TetR/AcrR family transcriptional regulator [Chloroflexota bacterium]MBE7433769.1 TetR/AcrR family transcriptional regulator [Anaerolineales bacterium]
MKTQRKPTPSIRRQRNREAMIKTILETAREIMREEGVAALTMHELARRLEIRPPSLYNYYNSKMEIYDELFRLGFELFSRAMQEAADAAESTFDDMWRSMEAYMNFALQNPELFKLCFERHVPGFVPSGESMKVVNRLMESAISRINLWAGRGGFNPQIPMDKAFDLVNAMMHGLASMHLANDPHLPMGEGRFGRLIPDAVRVFEQAWKTA